MAQTPMGNAFLINWYRRGVEIEKVTRTSNEITMFITVPEHNVMYNSANIEMAGSALAKAFKEAIPNNGMTVVVRSKTRPNTYWTHDDAQKAEIKMRMNLLLAKSAR